MISIVFMQNCHTAMKATEMVGRHMPHMRFLGTNWWDVQIAFIICVTIVIIALITAIVASCWHKRKLEALSNKEKQEQQFKIEKEKKEQQFKIEKDKAEQQFKIEKDKAEQQFKIEKDKAEQQFKYKELPYIHFKEICAMTKDKDGNIDCEKAKDLYALYQEMEKEPSANQQNEQEV